MEDPEEEEQLYCNHLQDYTQVMDLNPSTGLCNVCEQVDFTFNEGCSCRHIGDRFHFHIGTLAEILKKKFCPGCRLVLSAVSFQNISEDVFENIAVTIYIAKLSIGSMEGRNRSGLDGSNSFKRVERIGDLYNVVYIADRGTEKHGATAGAIIRMSPQNDSGAASLADTDFTFDDRADGCGRIVPPHVNMSLLKDWLEFCSSHQDICSRSKTDIEKPKEIRLIDVEGQRIVNTTTSEDFLALSYVWGSVAPLLNSNNWKRYGSRNALADARLPRTISDATELTCAIGKKYLWVDSLCIIQDDANNKQLQLEIMDEIYNSATLVIVAAAGTDAHAGIPGTNGIPRTSKQRVESVRGTQFVTIQNSVRAAISGSRWARRGWTFQESFFSRRALVFTENEVYWTCNVADWRESSRSLEQRSSAYYNCLTK